MTSSKNATIESEGYGSETGSRDQKRGSCIYSPTFRALTGRPRFPRYRHVHRAPPKTICAKEQDGYIIVNYLCANLVAVLSDGNGIQMMEACRLLLAWKSMPGEPIYCFQGP
jgi:hypothetical protein